MNSSNKKDIFQSGNGNCINSQHMLHMYMYVMCICACMLSCFSCISLFATLWTVAHRAPLSMEFPRQEYWSGLPFPSPGNLPDLGIKSRSSTLQEDSLPAEPQGKPKNTGVGSLSLLQRIFPTQELNWGLLHCRQTLYQLNYQGSPQVLISYLFSTFVHAKSFSHV